VIAAPESNNRDFAFDDEAFERCRRLIHEIAGIALSDAKQDLVYSRLVRRLRQCKVVSFHDYLDVVERDPGESEAFTNALTTDLTAFFREPHHFPLLAAHLRRNGDGARQTIWCSAASTGEEPYSIAMTAVEAFGSFDPPVRILASDIDTDVLAAAASGVYPEDRTEKLSSERLRRFFLRGKGSQAGRVRVRDELRRLIVFRRINLLDDQWPLRGGLDAIFCRNVMIYFDKATQLRILTRFEPLLQADGLLFAGHSESFHHATHLFRLQGKTVYGRTSCGADNGPLLAAASR